ncbi:cytochrome d ubiquinol oxidase subunit II [Adhaeribacter arboris]|uniref:cytochrome d ubiquinol oxidase subunit II n=1 Tax=Adhaeribacter arboris TaxID=2072846 RepID=UPI00267C29A7|nr:cytochrome d ubiquinol oxidase subunit II [Adhaeribacter arboris]
MNSPAGFTWENGQAWNIDPVAAIVILFTGFPRVYATISLALPIPLLIVLVGIVLRGSSFPFRHYGITHDRTHAYYTLFFKISSFVTPFFLGITLGAMILGEIRVTTTGSFYQQFIRPWCNVFCLAVGLFSTALFGYIAAVFLIGEANYPIEQQRYSRLSKILLFLTFALGILVFVAAEWSNHPLFHQNF